MADQMDVPVNELGLLIGGRLERGDLTIDVINPATGAAFAKAPAASVEQAKRAVNAAREAFPGWSATLLDDRRKALHAIAERIEANVGELGKLLTQEQGKPLADARGEVQTSAAFFRYFADLPYESEHERAIDGRRLQFVRKPLGVVAAIVPWNFPLTLMAFKVPPALLAGNTLVLKPAPTTPLATLKIAALIADLLPPGVLNVIADPGDLGPVLTGHPEVKKISFTGSTETGKKVMASAATDLKRLTLELGGNDPAIILDDVIPKDVASGIFYTAFHNAGQICIAIKRLYVHERIYDEMCAELVRLAKATTVGNGLAEGVQMGPLQNRSQYQKVQGLIEESRTQGTIIAGGQRYNGPGYFVEPTIVRDISDGTRLVDDEQFGPVLPVIRFSNEDDVVTRANAGHFGLGASVWSQDAERAKNLARRLRAGTVWINKHADLSPGIVFGGAGWSGMGAELGEEGLNEFTQLHVINA